VESVGKFMTDFVEIMHSRLKNKNKIIFIGTPLKIITYK
jgi:hypothetical protein